MSLLSNGVSLLGGVLAGRITKRSSCPASPSCPPPQECQTQASVPLSNTQHDVTLKIENDGTFVGYKPDSLELVRGSELSGATTFRWQQENNLTGCLKDVSTGMFCRVTPRTNFFVNNSKMFCDQETSSEDICRWKVEPLEDYYTLRENGKLCWFQDDAVHCTQTNVGDGEKIDANNVVHTVNVTLR